MARGRKKQTKELESKPFLLKLEEQSQSVYDVSESESIEELINSERVTEMLDIHGYVHFKFSSFGNFDKSENNPAIKHILGLENGFSMRDGEVDTQTDETKLKACQTRANKCSDDPRTPKSSNNAPQSKSKYSARAKKTPVKPTLSKGNRGRRKEDDTSQWVLLYCYKKIAKHVYERVLKRVPETKTLQTIMRMKKFIAPKRLSTDNPLEYMERFYDCLENDCKQLNSIYLVMEQNLTLPEEDSLPVIIDNISTPLQKNLRVGKFPGIHGCYTYFSFPNSVFELHAEDLSSNSLSVNYGGSSKIWIILPRRFSDQVRKLVQQVLTSKYKKLFPNCILQHKKYFFHPIFFRNNGIKFQAVVHHPGSAILTAYDALHQGVNQGISLAKAINITTRDYQQNFDPAMVQCRHNDVTKITIKEPKMISFGKEIGATSNAYMEFITGLPTSKGVRSNNPWPIDLNLIDESDIEEGETEVLGFGKDILEPDVDFDASNEELLKKNADCPVSEAIPKERVEGSGSSNAFLKPIVTNSTRNDRSKDEEDNESFEQSSGGFFGNGPESSNFHHFFHQTKTEDEITFKRTTTTTTAFSTSGNFNPSQKRRNDEEPSREPPKSRKLVAYLGKREDFEDQLNEMSPEDLICPFCKKEFKHKKNLTPHLNIHFGLVPKIPCPEEDCAKFFKSTGQLNQHISMSHLKIKYPCIFCGLHLSSTWKRKEHEARHSTKTKILPLPAPKM